MSVKVVEFVDRENNKVVINPASVCSIAEQDNWDCSPGQPEKLVSINGFGISFWVTMPIDEVRRKIFAI